MNKFNTGITKVSRTKLRTSKSKESNTNINDLDKNISKKSVKYFLNHNHKSERLKDFNCFINNSKGLEPASSFCTSDFFLFFLGKTECGMEIRKTF